VRLVAGRPAAAEAALRADLDALPAMGEGATLATSTALLAQAVFAQGRVEEALELCDTTAARAAPHDIVTQAIWRGVRAKAVALAGGHDEAEALARAAVALLAPTDLLSHHGDAMLDLAEVLRTCGRADEAEQVARDGLALYERKGNAAAAARALAQLG
jgi:ATP/maltotriose-dependent transcriptional regulator MalT